MQVASCYENVLGDRSFLYAWEPAYLGNSLSSMANLIVLAERTGVPVAFPNIAEYQGLFPGSDRDLARYATKTGLSDEDVGLLNAALKPLFDGYFPGYMAAHQTIRVLDLPRFAHARGITLCLPYENAGLQSWEEDGLEAAIADFCGRGNGLILPGAYWRQYVNMPTAGIYGPIIRAHFAGLQPDTCLQRVADMQAHIDHIKIGVHIRLGDYKHWYDGRYFFTVDEYAAIMRLISEQYTGIRHRFYVFSSEDIDTSSFGSLPVCYHRAAAVDDFSAMGRCDTIVGPPSTFATWAAFLRGTKRLVITRERMATMGANGVLIAEAVKIPFPTGGYLPGDPAGGPI